MKKTNLKAYEFQKREHKENAHYVKIEGTIYYVHDVFDAQAKETAEDIFNEMHVKDTSKKIKASNKSNRIVDSVLHQDRRMVIASRIMTKIC